MGAFPALPPSVRVASGDWFRFGAEPEPRCDRDELRQRAILRPNVAKEALRRVNFLPGSESRPHNSIAPVPSIATVARPSSTFCTVSRTRLDSLATPITDGREGDNARGCQ